MATTTRLHSKVRHAARASVFAAAGSGGTDRFRALVHARAHHSGRDRFRALVHARAHHHHHSGRDRFRALVHAHVHTRGGGGGSGGGGDNDGPQPLQGDDVFDQSKVDAFNGALDRVECRDEDDCRHKCCEAPLFEANGGEVSGDVPSPLTTPPLENVPLTTPPLENVPLTPPPPKDVPLTTGQGSSPATATTVATTHPA